MSGSLTLIPTPLKEEAQLDADALKLLQEYAADESTLILVEELKIARQRWLKWGLPRETIARFIAFNEHSVSEMEKEILPKLKAGASAVLMSDGGLPAFCDPGQGLVNRCHDQNIKVTATAFANSVALAVSLSGFSHQRFIFQGFLPQKDPERGESLKELWKNSMTQVVMETPYRRQKLLEELLKSRPESQKKRRIFLALELNGPGERLIRGTIEEVINKSSSLEKLEYVLLVDQLGQNSLRHEVAELLLFVLIIGLL